MNRACKSSDMRMRYSKVAYGQYCTGVRLPFIELVYYTVRCEFQLKCLSFDVNFSPQAHFVLQQAALQYERANGLHVAAKRRVREAEQRVFSSIEKRAFDAALQELLNTATTEVSKS